MPRPIRTGTFPRAPPRRKRCSSIAVVSRRLLRRAGALFGPGGARAEESDPSAALYPAKRHPGL